MRILLAALIAGVAGCSGTWDSDSPVLDELGTLPLGLEVIHSPTQVHCPVGPNVNDWPYRWNFRTEVRAIDRPLTIVKFGICAWDGTKWILPMSNRRYNAGVMDQKTFEDWYAHPGARILPGKPAVDPQNWAGSRTRASFKQKWFYIGRDGQGKRYKGEAVVELLDRD